MTVYDIPNIEHCIITPRLNGQMFMITTNEGWFIHLNDGHEETKDYWSTIVILKNNYPWEQVEIRAEADLPEGAEICADVENEEV